MVRKWNNGLKKGRERPRQQRAEELWGGKTNREKCAHSGTGRGSEFWRGEELTQTKTSSRSGNAAGHAVQLAGRFEAWELSEPTEREGSGQTSSETGES